MKPTLLVNEKLAQPNSEDVLIKVTPPQLEWDSLVHGERTKSRGQRWSEFEQRCRDSKARLDDWRFNRGEAYRI